MKLLKAFVFYVILVACASPSADAQTVYITKTGAKYHKSNCQYLRKSKIAIPMKDAIDEGYGPCSVCVPGGLSNAQKGTLPSTSGATRPTTSTTPATNSKEVKAQQCTATTKAGTRCKRMTTNANGRCYQH